MQEVTPIAAAPTAMTNQATRAPLIPLDVM
jgi:hypothetical protein